MRAPQMDDSRPAVADAAPAAAESAVELGWLEALLWAPRTGMLRALRHPNYRLFWAGNFLSNLGTWMYHVALGWLVLEMTNSPFSLGLVGFAQFAPALVFSLPGGVIADRVDRRRWLLATHAAMLLVAVTLAALVTLGLITYPLILGLALLLGIASAMNGPAYQAMVQDLSSREDVLNAIAMNSLQFNLSRFLGPALAGVLVSSAGLIVCFYVNAASFLAPLVALWRVEWRGASEPVRGPALGQLAEGARYLAGHRQILVLVGFVGLVSLFGLPYLVFLPVFARDVLGVGAPGLGYMISASGAGALLGALLLAAWPAGRRRGPLVLTGSLLFFSGVLALALSTDFYLSMAALVVTGGAMVSVVATVNSLIQTLVPDEIRGRVLSWHMMAYLGFHPVGALLIGAYASRVGTPAALAAAVTLPLAASLGAAFFFPWLRRLQ